MKRSIVALIAALVLVSACGAPQSSPREGPGFVNGKPVHPSVKMGDPYSVNGETYVPRYEPNYSETGKASWYGPGFHGKSTANGEPFDQHDLTAAHRTLPMPSMVRVTNLDNGKSVIVRVNDRGPFAHGRIIDLSRAAASKLDMLRTGTAQVRVEYLPRETETYIAQLGGVKSPDFIQWEQENTPVQTASTLPDYDVNKKSSSWFPSLISDANANEPNSTHGAAAVNGITSSELPPPRGANPVLPARLPHPAAPDYKPSVVAPSSLPPSLPPPQTASSPPANTPVEQKSYINSSFSVLDRQEPAKVTAPPDINAPPIAASTEPPPAKPSGQPRLAIQLGAFSSRNNAEKLGEKYAGLAPVMINGAPADAPALYRVRLGPFTDRYSAETVLTQVREKGSPDAQLVPY